MLKSVIFTRKRNTERRKLGKKKGREGRREGEEEVGRKFSLLV